MTELFNRCPTVVCVGDPNSGKTLCSSKSFDLIADRGNSTAKLEFERMSAASLRKDVFARQNVPVLIHDPPSFEFLKTVFEEAYDSQLYSDCGTTIRPGTSAVITCNEDYLGDFLRLDG